MSSSHAALRAASEARQRHQRAREAPKPDANATAGGADSKISSSIDSSNNDESSTRESAIASSSLRSMIRRADDNFANIMSSFPASARQSEAHTSNDNLSVEEYQSTAATAEIQREMNALIVGRESGSVASHVEDEVGVAADRSKKWNAKDNKEKDDSIYQPSVALPPRPRRIVDGATKLANTPSVVSSAASYRQQQNGGSQSNAAPNNTNSAPSTPLQRHPELMAPAAYATPNAAYAALPNRRENDASANNQDDEDSREAPKTPGTLMRSIKASISRDRNEMDGVRKRALFENKENGGHNGGDNGLYNGGDLQRNNGDEHDNGEEFDEFEDEEPNDSFHRREYNSSCLEYGSEIILRYRTPTALTSLSVQPPSSMVQHETPSHEERVCLIANETHGSFGREENRFVVIGANNKDEEDPSAPYVCYGDVITLRSSVTDRVLGVQKMEVLDKEHGGSTVTLKVGCFRRYGKYPPADRWVVLRGGSNVALVELGPDLPHDDHSRIPVYSGDPIVLRNDFTGGILSLGEEVDELFHALQGPDITGWSLNLITSSYQMHGGTASTEDDMELIEFLHRHNQCRPGKKETFQVVMANVPPCPNWIYQTEEGNERCFLDGSYLSNPNRHDASPELEDELWGDACPIPRLERGDDALQPPQKFASLSADVQETILLEEVIGAMMGLEGQFIRYHTGDFEPSNAEESMYPTQPGFVFAPLDFSGGKIDTSLEEIVSRILPLCSNYVSVNSYVQSCLCNYECGIIARALCEAMNKLLQEYLSFASNLDHQLREPSANNGKRMSMTMIHVRTQPASRTMSTLYQVVFAVQGRKGGDLLNSLQRLAKFNYSGDGKCNELLTHLLNVCAVHYARMLKSWLNTGRLHDPYNEFMIEVTNRNFQSNNVAIREGIEFEDWCRVNNTHVLMNLESSTELISPILTAFGVDRHRSTSHMSALDKVHTTGKYRRAIHFCHEGVPFLPAEEEETTSEEDAPMLLNPLKLLRYINVSYHKASDSLLQMMLEKYDLMASLQLMKRYFLIDQGDFFVEFLDIADEELARSASTLSQGRVQNAVVTSIGRTSDFVILPLNTNSGQISNLPHSSQLASALRCGFKKQSLVEELDDVHKISRGSSKGKTRQKELTGYEALQLEFEGIPFPTSLLLSHTQMRIYQLLFRQIFFAKYVERQLVGLWADHQLMKQMSSLREMRKTFCLRRRMIHFIQNFVYYIKFEVIEPNWIELESKLNAAKHRCSNPQAPESSGKFPRTVDDLLAEHNQFLISVINQCLLTNSDLIRASFKIMTTALLFTTQMKLFMGTTKINTHHETTRSECSKLRHSGAKKKIDDARKSQFRVQREERTRRCSDRIVREVCTENFQHMIDRFDNVFSSNLSDFMAALKCDYGRKSNGHFTNLFMQLDYNGYVSSSMENEQMSN